jgi:hypothetical protein
MKLSCKISLRLRALRSGGRIFTTLISGYYVINAGQSIAAETQIHRFKAVGFHPISANLDMENTKIVDTLHLNLSEEELWRMKGKNIGKKGAKAWLYGKHRSVYSR